MDETQQKALLATLAQLAQTSKFVPFRILVSMITISLSAHFFLTPRVIISSEGGVGITNPDQLGGTKGRQVLFNLHLFYGRKAWLLEAIILLPFRADARGESFFTL